MDGPRVERQRRVNQLLLHEGLSMQEAIDEVSREFGVGSQTVRKDIQAIGIEYRAMVTNPAEVDAIAAQALHAVHRTQRVVLDIATTTPDGQVFSDPRLRLQAQGNQLRAAKVVQSGSKHTHDILGLHDARYVPRSQVGVTVEGGTDEDQDYARRLAGVHVIAQTPVLPPGGE